MGGRERVEGEEEMALFRRVRNEGLSAITDRSKLVFSSRISEIDEDRINETAIANRSCQKLPSFCSIDPLAFNGLIE